MAGGARWNATRRYGPRSTGPMTCSTNRQRRLLGRLAVFAGGCTLDAAEAVCSGDPVDCARGVGAAGAASSPSRSSSPKTTGPTPATGCWRRSASTARNASTNTHETDALRARHAEYYVTSRAHVERAAAWGRTRSKPGRRLAAEQENLLAAMSFAVDTRRRRPRLALLRALPIAPVQVGFACWLPAEPVLWLAGASEHPLLRLRARRRRRPRRVPRRPPASPSGSATKRVAAEPASSARDPDRLSTWSGSSRPLSHAGVRGRSDWHEAAPLRGAGREIGRVDGRLDRSRTAQRRRQWYTMAGDRRRRGATRHRGPRRRPPASARPT